MASTSVSDLNGLFKTVYANEINDLVPEWAVLQKGLIPWVPADKLNGAFFAVPTVLKSNQGVTYLGENGGIASLSEAVSGEMKEAQIKGSELNVRGQITYKALSQAATAGSRAFKKSSAWLVEDLSSVAHTRVEISALYGQTGIGVVDGAPVDLATSPKTATVVISEASFAPGIWTLLEGAKVEAFKSDGSKRNDQTITVKSVNIATRTLTIQYSGTLSDQIASTDTLFPQGARTSASEFNEMAGLYKQLTATSGTLFNLDRANYSLLQGNTYGSTGGLTKAKIVEAAMLAVNKGCMSDLVCLVSTKAWAVLAAEDMALRVFDSSYRPEKAQSGARELVYESVNGSIKVICHPMIKYSEAFLFSPDDCIWVGSSKPTFEIPGFSGEFFRLVDGSNAVELQNFADLAIYHEKPGRGVVMTGITYE